MQRSDHVIIGAGHTGLFLAKQLAELDHKVLLIEQLGVGGSSVHNTDLPNQIIKQKSEEFALNLKFFKDDKDRQKQLLKFRQEIFDFTKWSIKERESQLQSEIESNPNIALLRGKGRFVKRNTLEIVDFYSDESKLLEYKNVYITAGKNCLAGLKLEGLESVPVCHKWNYWKFNQVPNSIAIVGFNEETLEIADIYSNFGIKVDIFESKPSYECLKAMDLTATNFLLKKLMSKKVDFNFGNQIKKVLYINNEFNIYLEDGYKHVSNQVYVPSKELINGDYLNLAKAKIKFANKGITTNYRGNTNVSNVYAFGSVTDKGLQQHKTLENFLRFKQLKHERKTGNKLKIVANSLSAVQEEVRMLHKSHNVPTVKIKSSNGAITVGMSEAVAKHRQNVKPEIIFFSHPNKDGFVKIIYNPKTREIVGFSSAGELSKTYASFLKYSYKNRLKLKEISNFLKFDIYSD